MTPTKSMWAVLMVELAVATLCIGILARKLYTHQLPVKAQNKEDNVLPYLITPLGKDVMHVEVYKMVHEGCELYIAQTKVSVNGASTVAITTGRGCK